MKEKGYLNKIKKHNGFRDQAAYKSSFINQI